MTPDLVALKQRVLDAEKEHLFWKTTNTGGQTAERLVEIDLAYRKAERRLREARAAYELALSEAAR